jgi:DDE superfamily endonuclease
VLKMAQDEGRFGRISIPKRAWAPPGMRPHVPKQVVRQSSYVYAAVAPEEGLMTSLVLPSSNTAMMNIFLAHVAEVFADYFIVMQTDQAGWHWAKELHIPENIRLIFQPAYSPEVNPVEHVWEEIREKYLHNLVFPSLDELMERLCQALSELTDDKDRLRSMTFFPHFRCASS